MSECLSGGLLVSIDLYPGERPVTVGRGRLQASRGRGAGMRGQGSLHLQTLHLHTYVNKSIKNGT